MKNIHILPTLQPSRLRIGDNRNFVFGLAQSAIVSKNDSFTNQNISITNSEEIKEGDWFVVKLFKITGESDGLHIEKCTKQDDVWCNNFDVISTRHKDNCKKIILTTDQDLIKDGIQAINDEFLNWFVKNPSCELVPIANEWKEKYKIIIPSEEPKQEPCDNCNNDVCCCIIRTQETLEEAKLRQLFKNRSNCYADADDVVQAMDENCFIETIKEWHQERSYSEEDMRKCWNSAYMDALSIDEETYKPLFFEDFIEQFKKK